MLNFRKFSSKNTMNYKRKSRFFGIFILKIVKFRQNFVVETLPENEVANIRIFCKDEILQKENLLLLFFIKGKSHIIFL